MSIDLIVPGGRSVGACEGRAAQRTEARRPRRWRGALSLVALAALLGGCSLAPVHERPALPVAAAWTQAQTPADDAGSAGGAAAGKAAARAATAAALTGWRAFYTDPELQRLIALALDHNRDLRSAVLDIEAARAQYGIQRADRLPGIGASAGAARQRVPADLSGAGSALLSERYEASVGITSFELDLFGRVRNLGEAALAEYLATAEARRAVQIGLVAQVAQTWLAERSAAEQIALLERTLQAREDSLRLVELRHQAGAAGELELRQAQSLVEGTRADRADARRELQQARNALELLVGTPLGAPAADARPLAELALPAVPAAGLPSDLLERRPDILAAEQRLRGASASIGAARAAFFPRIALTGALGTASSDLDGLFGAGSGIWSFAPRITLPIFDGGRNRAALGLAEVRRDQAVVGYEKAVQVAFREVADALAARATIAERLGAREAQVESARRGLELAELRYRGGVDSQLQWLDAQRTLLSAEQGLLAARVAQVANLVELYKALGGGWFEDSVQAPVSVQSPRADETGAANAQPRS